jgi:hypothetical protein
MTNLGFENKTSDSAALRAAVVAASVRGVGRDEAGRAVARGRPGTGRGSGAFVRRDGLPVPVLFRRPVGADPTSRNTHIPVCSHINHGIHHGEYLSIGVARCLESGEWTGQLSLRKEISTP